MGIPFRAGLLALPLVVGAVGCAAGQPEAQAPILRETPEDEVLQVAKKWVSSTEDKGFRGAPSRITVFSARTTSTITLHPGGATASEDLTFSESFKLTDSSEFRCQSHATVEVPLAFGDHAGEAGIELRRPALHLARTCDRPGFPEPTLDLAATNARFVLRGDQLVPIEPPTEARVYLPVP